jgi:uncharacterized membrane protein
MTNEPKSVEELTRQNIAIISRLEEATRSQESHGDRFVGKVTGFFGRIGFAWLNAVVYGLWIVVNLSPAVPKGWRFDPYPFQLLGVVVGIEAIFLAIFILISQNRQGRIAERRSQLDLQINLLAEQENTKMLSMLRDISRTMGIPDSDPSVSILAQATDPHVMIEQIEAHSEQVS